MYHGDTLREGGINQHVTESSKKEFLLIRLAVEAVKFHVQKDGSFSIRDFKASY